jgi:hypothetical protein
MFRKGGSTAQGSGITSLQPRIKAEDGYTPLDPISGNIFGQGITTPPLTREEVSKMMYAGKPVAGPTTAEKAILIGQIASTPGNLYEKMKASLPATAKILASKRAAEQKREEDIGTIVTKAGLQERLQRIKTEEGGPKLKRANEIFKTSISGLQRIKGPDGKTYYRDPETGVSRTEDFYKDQALKQVDAPRGYEGFEARKQKLYDNMLKSDLYKTAVKNLETKKKQLESISNEYQKKSTKSNKESLDLAQQSYNAVKQQIKQIEDAYINTPLNQEFPGQRVFKAGGGSLQENVVEETDSMANIIPSTPQVFKGLSYDQIRSSLPETIDNSVVNLLSTNMDALYEFANVSSQDDLNAFNMKYGTDAVLPAQG